MGDDKAKIAETLKIAIRGEEDGFRFYDLVSKRVTNASAKKKLETLRDDEIRHKQTLIAIFHQYVGPDIGELPEKGLSVLTEIFRKGEIQEKTSEMEFLNLAIEAELAATKYYQEQRELIADVEFRKIFDRLAEEEHHHFELLQAEREAITGNYSWFDYDGTSPMEH